MRNIEFQIGDYVHVFNRGAGKQNIFRDDADFRRFYQSLFLFNNIRFSNIGGYSDTRDEILLKLIDEAENDRQPFVEILSYCLLPNHFHLLLKQVTKNGVPIFLHKLSMGYSKYFNMRHQRTGTLYEGPYKAVLVEHEGHLEYLPKYIHLNALDLTSLHWRGNALENWDLANRLLNAYPWSSHHVYSGDDEELRTVNKTWVRDHFPTVEDYRAYLRTSPSDVPEFKDLQNT